jgi:hypothetical protein
MNLYAYVDNNPVYFTDPFGMLSSDRGGRRGRRGSVDIPGTSSQMAQDAVGRPDGTRGGFRDPEDALRHCIASCWYTLEFGSGVSEVLGVINEILTDVTGSQTTGDRGMDLANNATGRDVACGVATPEGCRTGCIDKLRTGGLVHGVPGGGPYPPPPPNRPPMMRR